MIRSIIKTEGSVSVFYVQEDLRARRVKDFAKKLNGLIDSGRIDLILDLGHVTEISMIALVTISSAFNKCRQQGGNLKISGLTPDVRNAFRETNLINTLEVYDSALEALKSFQRKNIIQSKNYTGSYYNNDSGCFVSWERIPVTQYLN